MPEVHINVKCNDGITVKKVAVTSPGANEADAPAPKNIAKGDIYVLAELGDELDPKKASILSARDLVKKLNDQHNKDFPETLIPLEAHTPYVDSVKKVLAGKKWSVYVKG